MMAPFDEDDNSNSSSDSSSSSSSSSSSDSDSNVEPSSSPVAPQQSQEDGPEPVSEGEEEEEEEDELQLPDRMEHVPSSTGLEEEEEEDDDDLDEVDAPSEARSSPLDLGLDLSDSESQFNLIGNSAGEATEEAPEEAKEDQEAASEPLPPKDDGSAEVAPPPPPPPPPGDEAEPAPPMPPPPPEEEPPSEKQQQPPPPSESDAAEAPQPSTAPSSAAAPGMEGELDSDEELLLADDDDEEEGEEEEGEEEEGEGLEEEDLEEEMDEEMDEELYKMLDESTDRAKEKEKSEANVVRGPQQQRKRLVLVRKDRNEVDVLPKDWIALMHQAGVLVYLHRPTRVITLSKPYSIGPGSCKRHKVPLSAIPCLSYRRAIEEEEAKAKEDAARAAAEAKGDADADKGEENSDKDPANAATGKAGKCPFKGPSSSKSAMPPRAKVQSVEDLKEKALDPSEVHNYAKKLFHYEVHNYMKFDTWGDRRRYIKMEQKEQLKRALAAEKGQENGAGEDGEKEDGESESKRPRYEGNYHYRGGRGGRPYYYNRRRGRGGYHYNHHHQKEIDSKATAAATASLPKGTKIITIPVLEAKDANAGGEGAQDKGGASGAKGGPLSACRVVQKGRKEWILNPHGKSNVCILHEYLQHALKKQPVYKFEEVESSNTPYRATVLINDVKHGEALGSSKKNAKSEAARNTLKILIPEISDQLDAREKGVENTQLPDLKYMDDIPIDDPSVPKLCDLMSEPCPYTILVTCLQRNFGLGDTSIHNDLTPIPYSKLLRYTMKVNDREVSVKCRNKKDGKQKAAQTMLKELLPQLSYWGSVLRMFGSHSIHSQKLKREKEAEVTSLQNRSESRPAPSLVILEKLKKEMRNLHEMKKAMEPLEGKFVPPLDSAEVRPISNTCLDKVNL